jgi:hypothetical protein
MTIEEFLTIMADNASEFPEFAALPQEQKEAMAKTNIITGPAEAFRNANGRLVGVGGMRIIGVAEGWLITPREIRSHPDHTLRREKFAEFLQITQGAMKKMCDENSLWRVFATGKLSTTFLEKLGFEKIDKTLVWSRTE